MGRIRRCGLVGGGVSLGAALRFQKQNLFPVSLCAVLLSAALTLALVLIPPYDGFLKM